MSILEFLIRSPTRCLGVDSRPISSAFIHGMRTDISAERVLGPASDRFPKLAFLAIKVGHRSLSAKSLSGGTRRF
jgi:hypothetical protein